MGHDTSEANEKPSAPVPCLGCGRRDGLIAVIKGKPHVYWCMRCGTLLDAEDGPLDALIPQLAQSALNSLGSNQKPQIGHRKMTEEEAAKTREQVSAEEAIADPPQPTSGVTSQPRTH